MYNIIKSINDETKLAMNNSVFYILKRISLEDTETVKKLMKIDNEHIVKFIDIVNIEGVIYAVEEYINGVTLKEYLDKRGKISEQEIKNIAASVCLGLKDVHALGIVHRDINPNNIMVDAFHNVKIIDFGISRTKKEHQKVDTHILGTYGYAAPEQYGFSQTTQKADIYAIGVLINYMATGVFPHEAMAEGHLGEVVRRCTAIDEKQRYDGVDILLNDLMYGTPKKRSIIPGFRSNTTINKVAAVLYYALFIFLLLGFTLTPATQGYTRSFWALFIVLLFGVPVPIFTNFLNWYERLSFTKYYSKQKRKWFIAGVGTAYEIIAFFILIIIS